MVGCIELACSFMEQGSYSPAIVYLLGVGTFLCSNNPIPFSCKFWYDGMQLMDMYGSSGNLQT